MSFEGIDRWPGGQRPVFFATPGAWDILHILDHQDMSLGEALGLLAPYSLRDLRGAFFLTRDLDQMQRRATLVSGADRGRARRIRARLILRRAYASAQMLEEAERLTAETSAILDQVRADLPATCGYRVKTARQVLALAGSAQPLLVRLRLLMEVRLLDLTCGAARLEALAPGQFIHGRWPTEHERQMTLRTIALASGLLSELA